MKHGEVRLKQAFADSQIGAKLKSTVRTLGDSQGLKQKESSCLGG